MTFTSAVCIYDTQTSLEKKKGLLGHTFSYADFKIWNFSIYLCNNVYTSETKENPTLNNYLKSSNNPSCVKCEQMRYC